MKQTKGLSKNVDSLIEKINEKRLPSCNDVCEGFNNRGLPHDFDTRVMAYLTTNPAFPEEDRSLILKSMMQYNPEKNQSIEPMTVHGLREFRKALTIPADQLKDQVTQLSGKLEDLSNEIENKEDYCKTLINEIGFLTSSMQTILENSTDKVSNSESIVIDLFNQALPNAKIIEIIKDQNRKIIRYFKEEAEKTSRDPLTGLYNRGTLDSRLEKLIKECIESNTPLSLMFIDIDDFKQINDTYGHLFGDKALKFVVDKGIKEILKLYSYAFGARYGGEEFIIILKGIDLRTSFSIAETLRKKIETSPFQHFFDQQSIELNITVSIGISDLQPDCDDPLNDLMGSADKALYQAKESGKNRVCLYQSI